MLEVSSDINTISGFSVFDTLLTTLYGEARAMTNKQVRSFWILSGLFSAFADQIDACCQHRQNEP
jgi:hypothetical protein